MQKKALFINWGILLNDIPVGLRNIGVETHVYEERISIATYAQEEVEQLVDFLRKNPYDFVISNNFIRQVAEACQTCGVKYASWIFDSPQIALYTKEALYDCNYVFVFDRKQEQRMREQGLKYVFYLPLATSVDRVSALKFTQEDIQNYTSDISFVGMLYEKNHYNETITAFSKEEKEYLDSIIMKTVLHWGKEYSVFGSISEKMSGMLSERVKPWDIYDVDYLYFHELYYLVGKVTEIDRICILNGLALEHKVDLYTKSFTGNLEGVQIHGGVDYNTEAPKVFNLSRINLNMTMRSIETGVPQRIFDIMGAGGFVLSNWQEEIEELFVPDKEIVLYRDMDELIYKVNYYLKNEQQRLSIAIRGYQKVKECYTYEVALKKMLGYLEV